MVKQVPGRDPHHAEYPPPGPKLDDPGGVSGASGTAGAGGIDTIDAPRVLAPKAFPPSYPTHLTSGILDAQATAEGEIGVSHQAYTTNQDVGDWKIRQTVKMFITWPNGAGDCSGTLIGTKTVLTAAHCLYNPGMGGFATSIVAVPGLSRLYMPYGFANAVAGGLYISEYYYYLQDDNYDYGYFILDKHLGAPTVAGHVGAVALSDGDAEAELFYVYGYPDAHGNGIESASTLGFVECVTGLAYFSDAQTSGGISGGGNFQWVGPWEDYVAAIRKGTGYDPFCDPLETQTWETRLTSHRLDNIWMFRDNPNLPVIESDPANWAYHEGFPNVTDQRRRDARRVESCVGLSRGSS